MEENNELQNRNDENIIDVMATKNTGGENVQRVEPVKCNDNQYNFWRQAEQTQVEPNLQSNIRKESVGLPGQNPVFSVNDTMKNQGGQQGNPYPQNMSQQNAYQQVQSGFQQNAQQLYGAQSQPVKGKKENSTAKKVGKGFAVGAAAALGFCSIMFGANKLGVVDQGDSIATIGNNNSIAATVVTSGGAISAEKDLTAVVDKCMPSIVSINSTVTETYNSFYGTYDKDSIGSGSGIILKMSEDEILIVTNNHVIDGAKKIVVGFYGAKSEEDMIEATVKGTNGTNDLAVVLVSTKNVPEEIRNNIRAIEIGSSDNAKVGELAIAIGNALGCGQSMTVGYISAKDRKVAVDEKTTMTLLQTDAAINPGNSGGALVNANGELIAINSAKYSDTSVEGMGFAIPISDAIDIINELMEREVLKEEEKGYLGIKGTNITEEVQAKYSNMPLGIYVSEISNDGAAASSGIKVGDIITGVDGEEILTIEALAEKVNSYRIGTKITLVVKRYDNGEYKEKKIKVTLKGKDTLNSISDEQAAKDRSGENSAETPKGGKDQQSNPFKEDEGQYDNQSPYGNEADPFENYGGSGMEEFFNYFFNN